MKHLDFITNYIVLYMLCLPLIDFGMNIQRQAVYFTYDHQNSYHDSEHSTTFDPLTSNNRTFFYFYKMKNPLECGWEYNFRNIKDVFAENEYLITRDNQNNFYFLGNDHLFYYKHYDNKQQWSEKVRVDENDVLLNEQLKVSVYFIHRMMCGKGPTPFNSSLFPKKIIINNSPFNNFYVPTDIFKLIIFYYISDIDFSTVNIESLFESLFNLMLVSKSWRNAITLPSKTIYTNIIKSIYNNNNINYVVPIEVFTTRLLTFNHKTVSRLFSNYKIIEDYDRARYLKRCGQPCTKPKPEESELVFALFKH